MVPADVLTALNEGLAAVSTVAAMAFLVVVSISAFKSMRSAVYLDSKGNEYRSEKDANEAEARAFDVSDEGTYQSYDDWVSSQKPTPDFDPDYDETDRTSDEYLADRYRAYEEEVEAGNNESYADWVERNDPEPTSKT